MRFLYPSAGAVEGNARRVMLVHLPDFRKNLFSPHLLNSGILLGSG